MNGGARGYKIYLLLQLMYLKKFREILTVVVVVLINVVINKIYFKCINSDKISDKSSTKLRICPRSFPVHTSRSSKETSEYKLSATFYG